MNKYILKAIIFHTLLFFIIIFSQRSFSQENLPAYEIDIENNSSNIIYVRIYPISFVFNGDIENDYRYDLHANHLSNPILYNFINGRNLLVDSFQVNGNSSLFINHDRDATTNGTKATVGFGKYKIVIWNIYDFGDTLTVEWDAGYPHVDPIFETRWSADLHLYYYEDNNNNPSIFFKWGTGIRQYPISFVNKNIVAWDQQYVLSPAPSTDSVRLLRPKEFGNFILDTINNNTYNVIPQDSRVDCGLENHKFDDNRSGVLTLNLKVNKNISTRDTLIDEPTNIVISKKAALIINSGRIFDMITPVNSYNNLIVEDTAYLVLYNSAKINVFSPNRITLKNKSNLTLGGNSEIRIKNGAAFCNEGCRIYGHGKIIFEKGIHEFCSNVNDFAVRDSAKIILEDSAVVILPDNYTLRLRGNTTSLIMKPGSKMMFGENSGIVCDSGAKVIANNATFTSFDSTKIWNGISLKHRSRDTIKNCIIKNADFGVNIMNKNDDEETEIPYSTEISGCSFSAVVGLRERSERDQQRRETELWE